MWPPPFSRVTFVEKFKKCLYLMPVLSSGGVPLIQRAPGKKKKENFNDTVWNSLNFVYTTLVSNKMCQRNYAYIKHSYFRMDSIIRIFSQYLKLTIFRNWRWRGSHLTVREVANSMVRFDGAIYQNLARYGETIRDMQYHGGSNSGMPHCSHTRPEGAENRAAFKSYEYGGSSKN